MGRSSRPGLSLRSIIETGQAREDARALAEGLAQTARLERARGGEVEQAQGRLRITSRDGLLTLHERGGLERPEYASDPACVQLRGAGSGQRPQAGGADAAAGG